MPSLECVPNVSEGRRPEVIDACRMAIAAAGSTLLDVSADPEHNRSVYTFVGEAADLSAAVGALFDVALRDIDLRHHRGVHPRLGAVDVVPFVPLGSTPMADAIALAREVAAAVADRHHLPVFLYEEAASSPERRRLERIRQGGFERLALKMREPGWAPDFGPAEPHPTAGATVIGARRFLIAYNVTLGTGRLDIARRIAKTIRESSGGLPAVKAMGVPLADRGIVQVSMNLTDYTRTSMVEAFDAISREAAQEGVDVLASELIGLAPAAALSAAVAAHIRLENFSEDRILERRLRQGSVQEGQRAEGRGQR